MPTQSLVRRRCRDFCVKILVDLEDYITERLQDKAQFKKLSARQGRALNRMKLTLKKHNKAYQVVVDAYRQNPTVSDDEDDDDDDDDDKSASSSSSDSSSASSESGGAKSSSASSSASSSSSDSESASAADAKSSVDDDDDDDAKNDSMDEWMSDASSSASSDSEGGAYAELRGRARWLKKNTVGKEKVVKNKDERAKARQEAKQQATAKSWEASQASQAILPAEDLTPAVLLRKAREIAAQRGRRGKDNRQLLRELEACYRLATAFEERVEIPVLAFVISAQFGLQRTMDDCMDTSTWKTCATYLARIASVLEDGYTLVVESSDETELYDVGTQKIKAAAKGTAEEGAIAQVAADEELINPHTGEAETIDERAERLRLEKEAGLSDEDRKKIPVLGSLSLFLSQLEEEYTKSLQKISHHSPEYIVRLRDESKLVELLTRFQSYFERENVVSQAAALAQLRIEHIYYRHDTIAKQVDKAAQFYEKFGEVGMLHPSCITSDLSGKDQDDWTIYHPASFCGKPTLQETENVDFRRLMLDLTSYVYQHGTEQAQTRATICQVYHHALHDRFLEARDLLLMSHLQDTIYNSGDVSTMVLFNRMMVTLGMCAFRLGRIQDAHHCLSDICSGRVRELLAQGLGMGRFERNAEQEKAEKRRQVPYHQHINVDLLEACHLISAMLLEVPNMASVTEDARRARVISRSFRKFHDQYNHQVFTGPPEQTRDYVMRATMALKKGDWKTCYDLIKSMDVWKLVPGENAAHQIADMLENKIKLEALRTYLFTFSAQYDSLSLRQLCGIFNLSKNEVHSVVSKMMINRELYASWDQPTETIVLRKVEPSPLQVMALNFAEKAASLVEANERLLDSQSGGGHKEDWKDEDSRWQNRSGGTSAYHYRRDGDRNTGNTRNNGDRSGFQRSQNRQSGGSRNRGRRF